MATRRRRQPFVRYAPLLVLFACSVEERPLSYGASGQSGESQAGRAHYDPGASGGEAGMGGEGGRGGEGDPTHQGGDDAVPAPQAGSAGNGGTTSLGGSSAATAGSASGGTAPSGSANSGGTLGGGGLGTSGGGNASAGSGGVDPNQGPCGDLNSNGAQDCTETIVENATFDSDPKHWSADPGVAVGWSNQDALGQTGSGSLSVKFTTSDGTSTWATSAAGQCLQAWEGSQLVLGGRVLIPSGQGTGNAQINLAMFGNDACAGSFIGSTAPLLTAQIGAWQPLHSSVKLAPGTRSVMVRLALAKPGTEASLEAHFDDILLHAE